MPKNSSCRNFFKTCLRQSKIPNKCNDAIIILLHKKGNAKETTELSVLFNCVYKIVIRVTTNRRIKILNENKVQEQAGFRKSYSTIDYLKIFNQFFEKTTEYNIPFALAFVVYKKSFNSLETEPVTTILKQQGIDPVYINTLHHIYNN